MPAKTKLPRSDIYGNIWLGQDHRTCAAIFPCKRQVLGSDNEIHAEATGGFTLWLGRTLGFLTENGIRRQEFKTAQEALEAWEAGA